MDIVTRQIVPLCTLIALATVERAAVAQPSPPPGACHAVSDVVIVKGSTARSLQLTVQRDGGGALIHVPGGIDNLAKIDNKRFDTPFADNDTKLYIVPRASAQAGDTIGGRLFARSGFEIGFQVRVVETTEAPRDAVLVLHATEQQRLQQKVRKLAMREARKIADEQRRVCVKQVDHELEKRKRLGIQRVALQGLSQREMYPQIDQSQQSDGPLVAEFTRAQWGKDVLLVYFAIENTSSKPYRVRTLAVFDRNDELMPTEHVYLNDVLNQKDAILTAMASGTYVPPAVTLIDGRYPLDRTLQGEETVTGVIALPVVDDHDIEPHALRLYNGKRRPLAGTGLDGWTTLRPVYREEVERRRRARQVSVNVRVLGGGFWLDDGAQADMLASTSMSGLGVRLSKGMHENFAFEGELIGGKTGHVDFVGVSWGEMQGDISRAATFGRLQGSGVIRFGDRYIVSARAGLGVQGVSNDSRFSTGGVVMDGPGLSLQVDVILAIGAGLDMRIGDHWILGTGFSAVSSMASAGGRTGLQSLGAWLQMGYSFNLVKGV